MKHYGEISCLFFILLCSLIDVFEHLQMNRNKGRAVFCLNNHHTMKACSGTEYRCTDSQCWHACSCMPQLLLKGKTFQYVIV